MACVLSYANGDKEASRALERPGIASSVKHQALGRKGECLGALHFGLDPLHVLDWRTDKPDRGWDFRHPRCGEIVSVDVKTTFTRSLIWPVTKNHFLATAMIDVLMCIAETAGEFSLLGWITRRAFIVRCHTAPPPENYDPGTRYLGRDELIPMSRWDDPLALCRWSIRMKAQFEYISGQLQ